MDNPDVSQLPTDGPNTPASGRYGTGAEQSRLEAALPRNPPPAGGPSPSPGPAGGGAQVAPPRPRQTAAPGVPEGVPAAIAAPTDRPNTPITAPQNGNPVGPQGATQKRLALLHQLAISDTVSPETRDWAQDILRLVAS